MYLNILYRNVTTTYFFMWYRGPEELLLELLLIRSPSFIDANNSKHVILQQYAYNNYMAYN